jgi:tripartite-type tricarboxylate transporter receptor subunit TctC
MVKKLNFTTADFQPVAVICRLVPVIAVKASLRVKTLKDFVALAKARPGGLNYGSQGVGTYGHLGMEDFKQRAGIDMVHVPYRGGAPANEALVRGDVDVVISNYAAVAPFEQSGDVVLLAAADSRRSNLRPALPTVTEQGISFSVSTWFGIFAPAGVPPHLVARIRDGVETVLESEKSSEFLKISSCERMKATPAQISDLIAADYRHWRTVIQSVGIQVE